MSFDPSNGSLRIWESTRTPIPKMGVLGSVWAHSLTLSCTPRNVNVIPMLHSWLAPFHALILVTNLGKGCNTFCFNYKNSKSLEETNIRYATIRCWWLLLRAMAKFFVHKFSN